MSQHQQNWDRIISELRKSIDQIEGPIEGRDWAELGDDTKDVFASQVQSILEAELSNRLGEEMRVNVKIKKALETIGEQLVRDMAARGEATGNV
jgi:hypothetical protein